MQAETADQDLAGLPFYLLAAIHSFLDRECVLAVTNAAGSIVFANDAFCRVSGYAREELMGRNHRILKSGVHPREFYADLWRTVSGGNVWRGEICNRAKSGRLYWVKAIITPIRNERGEITHYFALRIDITEKKAALLRLLEEERMALVGHVADGVAHDIKGYLTAATLALGESKEIEPGLKSVLSTALAGMNDLTTKLRDLAKVGGLEKKLIDIARLADCAGRIAEYRSTGNRTLKVECELEPLEGTCVWGNEGEIVSAILNLLSNSIEALEQVKPARIRLTGSVGSGRVRLTVRDNGPGVPAEILTRLFEPLVSSKGAGRGRGLSMAKRIAEEHQGSLAYEAGVPRGAVFHLTLPLA